MGKNIMGVPKMWKKLWCIQLLFFQYCYRNIRLFSITSCKVMAYNLLCFTLGISFFFLIALFKVITLLSSIAIALVIALLWSRGIHNYILFERAITIWEAIQKRSHAPIYKLILKMKQRGYEQKLARWFYFLDFHIYSYFEL